MKLLCRLPDKKFFRPISGTEEWQYIWELRQSNRLRLYARNGDPWSGENGEVVITIRAAKTGNQSKNQERHCNRFDLIVANSSDDIEGECEIIFQISQGLPYFTGRNFGVYSFPITEFTGKGNTIFMIMKQIGVDRNLQVEGRKTDKIDGSQIQKDQKLRPKRVSRKYSRSVIESAATINNQDRTNEERMEEAITSVKLSVEKLKKIYDWSTLNSREKIALIKSEISKSRGFGISTQTLYRPWLRNLW